MRTPTGLRSKPVIVPKPAWTAMPLAWKASATQAATSGSSARRMRSPASNSSTLVPKALNTEATWAPVAPEPITSMEAGGAFRDQASLWVLVSSKPGIASLRLTPPVHRITLSACRRRPVAVSMM